MINFFIPTMGMIFVSGFSGILAVLLWMDFRKRSRPNAKLLAIVDLVSFTFGGASILGFLIGASFVEIDLAGELLRDGSIVNYGDPYDPDVIYPKILAKIDELCPNDSACTEIIDEYRSWRTLKGQLISSFTSGKNAPTEIKELIAKFNFGFENHLRPAFGNDLMGTVRLILLCLLSAAYALGIWRRVHIIRAA